MAFGLYKPGQGYWVRVLAATMAGVLVLAAAAWLWNELEKAGQYIPRPTYSLTLTGVTGTATPGQTVELLGEPSQPGGDREDLGAGTVTFFDSGLNHLTVGHFELKGSKEPSGIRAIGPGPGSTAALQGLVSGNPQPNPIFDPLYLQAAGVAVLVIAGAFLTYWLTGVRPSTVEFLIATDGEMKKVNWSTRRDIIGSTWVVILWSVLLAAGLWAVDFVFSQFFKMIQVLQS